jgi:hypothetical protein
MNAEQRKTVDRFSRALVFIKNNSPVMTDASPGFAKQVQTLQTAVTAIQQTAPDRGSGVSAKTANQRAVLSRALQVNQLTPILRVAHVLARTVAGLPRLVPVSSRVSSTQGLIDLAKAVIRDITPYREEFIDKGLSVNFLDRVNMTIQALDAVRVTNETARQAATGARGTLVKALQDGRDALTLLDSAIREMCNANPAQCASALAVWNTIVRPRGRASQKVGAVVNGTLMDVVGVGDAP